MLLMGLMLLVNGCATVKVNELAVCSGTSRFVDRHADALLAPNVPDDVVMTGASLIAALDAACQV
jgi:hypothetical protein